MVRQAPHYTAVPGCDLSTGLYILHQFIGSLREPPMSYQQPPLHEPTPAEIRQRCIEIQMGWTRQVEESRRVHKYDQRFAVPLCKFPQEIEPPRDEVSY